MKYKTVYSLGSKVLFYLLFFSFTVIAIEFDILAGIILAIIGFFAIGFTYKKGVMDGMKLGNYR